VQHCAALCSIVQHCAALCSIVHPASYTMIFFFFFWKTTLKIEGIFENLGKVLLAFLLIVYDCEILRLAAITLRAKFFNSFFDRELCSKSKVIK